MSSNNDPQCGDWFKLVEESALKRHGDNADEFEQGDYFRFIQHSPTVFYQCYVPRKKGCYWILPENLLPIKDKKLIAKLEKDVPPEFRDPPEER